MLGVFRPCKSLGVGSAMLREIWLAGAVGMDALNALRLARIAAYRPAVASLSLWPCCAWCPRSCWMELGVCQECAPTARASATERVCSPALVPHRVAVLNVRVQLTLMTLGVRKACIGGGEVGS